MVNDLPLFNVTNPRSLWDSKLRNYREKKNPQRKHLPCNKARQGCKSPQRQGTTLSCSEAPCSPTDKCAPGAGSKRSPGRASSDPTELCCALQPPCSAVPGVTARCPPAQCPMGASGRVLGTEHSWLGRCSCRAEGAGAGINGALYMPLSRRLGSVPTGLGLSCCGWFALTPSLTACLAPRYSHKPRPALAMSGGTEGRGSLPDRALEIGAQTDGVCRSLGALGRSAWRGPLSWQQHPACLPAVAAAGASAHGRAGAQCLSQNLIRCQKPFVCDVWLPKPVVPGLEAGGEQGGC